MNHDTVQTLATKLDLGHISQKDARAWVKRTYGLSIAGRTRDQFIREAAAIVRARHPADNTTE